MAKISPARGIANTTDHGQYQDLSYETSTFPLNQRPQGHPAKSKYLQSSEPYRASREAIPLNLKNMKKRNKTSIVLGAAAIATLLGMSSSYAATVYDWSTASASASGVLLSGNDNWAVNADTADVVRNSGQPTAFSGNYLQMGITGGTNSDTVKRPNDGAFSYSIPSGAPTLTMSLVLTAGTSQGLNWMGLSSASGSFRFGQRDSGNWGVRELDNGIYDLGLGSGAGMLTATVKSYRVTVDIDLINDELDFFVENLTDGGSEMIATNVSIDNFDPSTFDGLFLRGRNKFDTFTIAPVPEPSTFGLLGLAGLGLIVRRRK